MTSVLKGGLCILLTLSIYSCKEKEASSKIVAKVFDQELSIEELSIQIDNTLSKEDSTIVAAGIIESWVKTKMLISQAERNLPDSLKDFTKQLEAEKNSLLIYTYENEYIKQNLDTLVLPQELDDYYSTNKSSFILSDYILRYKLIKVSSSTEAINKRQINRLLSSNEDNYDDIASFCSEIGATFSLDSTWWYLEEFLENVPIEVYNNESFLKKQKLTDFEADNFRYFVYIPEYKLKDAESPLELVEEKIKTLILNRRKQAMIKKLRSDLYQQAVRENQIKYFE